MRLSNRLQCLHVEAKVDADDEATPRSLAAQRLRRTRREHGSNGSRDARQKVRPCVREKSD